MQATFTARIQRKLEEYKAVLKSQYDRLLKEVKSEIKEKDTTSQTRWEIKRDACLAALRVVDAFHSNLEWGSGTERQEPERQEPPKIEEVRECYNRLALSCDSDKVLEHFKRCLGLSREQIRGDMIVDLRNAIRNELGFGKEIDTDREKAWAARINPPAS